MNADNITTRTATLADMPILLQFQQGIVETERPFDPTLKDGELHYHNVAAIISSSDAELIVAVVDEKMVGCGYGQLRYAQPYLRHERYCYVGLVFVREEYRGKGVNQKIIDALKDWSRSRNIYEMRLEVYSSNARAIAAYKKVGFSPHMLVMRTDLH